jgi:hypothetical protein
MDLVKDRERQDLPDARDRAEPVEGIGVVALGLAHDGELALREELVVALEQGDVDGDALLYGGVREVLYEPLPVGRVGDPLLESQQVVLVLTIA